jgi:hypothetical protein
MLLDWHWVVVGCYLVDVKWTRPLPTPWHMVDLDTISLVNSHNVLILIG